MSDDLVEMRESELHAYVRDAVREALENAAQTLETYRRGDLYKHVNRSYPFTSRSLDDCSWAVAQCRDKVRSLIPEGDTE